MWEQPEVDELALEVFGDPDKSKRETSSSKMKVKTM